jgi:hypothetical protein
MYFLVAHYHPEDWRRRCVADRPFIVAAVHRRIYLSVFRGETLGFAEGKTLACGIVWHRCSNRVGSVPYGFVKLHAIGHRIDYHGSGIVRRNGTLLVDAEPLSGQAGC